MIKMEDDATDRNISEELRETIRKLTLCEEKTKESPND
jgi:hypothetical protein